MRSSTHVVLGLWIAANEGAKSLKVIYQAADDETAAKTPLNRTFMAARIARVIPFFAFPPDVRKIIYIYTTNAIESLNRVIRKTTKTRGRVTTDEAATKLPYRAIRNFEKKDRVARRPRRTRKRREPKFHHDVRSGHEIYLRPSQRHTWKMLRVADTRRGLL